MKTQKMSRLSLIPLLLFAVMCAYCAQRTDTTELTTKEVLSQLSKANTQTEAEIAVRAVFRKAGVGAPDKEGNYEYYNLSDAQLTDLAALHIDYVNSGKGAATVGALYDVSLSGAAAVNPVVRKFQLNFTTLDLSLDALQQQGNSALQEPEKADNAFLIATLSQGAEIPETAPRFNRETALGPVQAFLFNLWLLDKAKTYPIPTQGEQGLGPCEAGCLASFPLISIGCANIVRTGPGFFACAGLAGFVLRGCFTQCQP